MTGTAPRAAFAALLGSHTSVSRSPAMYRAAFDAAGVDWTYELIDTTPAALPQVLDELRHAGAVGCNVTMPLKAAAARTVDALDESAARIGALNCVTFTDAATLGSNTDIAGFTAALAAAEVDRAERCVVIGAGGAARAVIAALDDADVSVVARSTAAVDELSDTLGVELRVGSVDDIAAADLVINATPVGMATGPAPHDTPVPAALLRDDLVVVDLVTNPAVTPLLHAARSVGARTVDGFAMLAHQGAAALAHWGLDVDAHLLETAARGGLTTTK